MSLESDRRRATASLCLRWSRLLRFIIRASQNTRLDGLVTPQSRGASTDPRFRLEAGLTEFYDGTRFFTHFCGHLMPHDFRGLRVLDIGCGFGGRTIFYASRCGAREVVGVEPFPAVIERCCELKQEMSCEAVTFVTGRAEGLPFESEAFDVVVSFDVIEHVQDPEKAFREVRRVLHPGGRAWLVFPTYLGVRSSHLDFITRVPALHRIFDPETIVNVVNHELRAEPGRFGVNSLRLPSRSSLGHLTLPNLNGITRREARYLMEAAGLDVSREVISPFVRPTDPVPGAGTLAGFLDRWQTLRTLPEFLIGSLAYELC